MKKALLALAMTGVLLAAGGLAPAAENQLEDVIFAEVYAAREAAEEQNASLLSPKNWARATRALELAEVDFANEANLQRTRERVASAQADFKAAAAAAARAHETFSGLLKVREDARSVDGYLHGPDSWKRAEARFRDALAELEAGDSVMAARRADEAEDAYRAAELSAIKASLLLESRSLVASAEAAKAKKYAPKTLASAKSLLSQADNELTQNRYDADLPRSLARDANYEARHALFLSNYIQEQRKAKAGWEDVILACERSINSIAAAAELPATFDNGVEPPTSSIVDYVQEQRAARRRLERDLEERNEQIYAMQEELSRLEERLGGVSEERTALTRRLAEQDEQRQRFERVEGLFEPEEGEVLRSGADVILRLTGLQFDTGESEITDSHTALLGKVMSAIGEFPGARIVVEGNTDSHGSNRYNDRLSTDRARSVRKFLLTNMELPPALVDSAGYGESRPIATNDTREGRARNRRIDIIIRTRHADDTPGV
ncbi:MAG: OmpA family protein [Pseudomonadota bacterium]